MINWHWHGDIETDQKIHCNKWIEKYIKYLFIVESVALGVFIAHFRLSWFKRSCDFVLPQCLSRSTAVEIVNSSKVLQAETRMLLDGKLLVQTHLSSPSSVWWFLVFRSSGLMFSLCAANMMTLLHATIFIFLSFLKCLCCVVRGFSTTGTWAVSDL